MPLLSDASPNAAAAGLPAARYGRVAMVLHWLLALLIVSAFGVGLTMVALPFSPAQLRLFSWHKWVGIAVLALSGLRLLWRLTHPVPLPRDPAVPRWERGLYRLTQGLLYLLFFAVPLSGWAYSSAAGFPVVWLGLWPLPDWVPVDPALAEASFKPLHHLLAWALGAAVLLHVVAVLKHQFIDHRPVLWRMWPASRGKAVS